MMVATLCLTYAALATVLAWLMASYPILDSEQIAGLWRGVGLIWVSSAALGLSHLRAASPRQRAVTGAVVCLLTFGLGYLNSWTPGGDIPWLFLMPSGLVALVFLVRLQRSR